MIAFLWFAAAIMFIGVMITTVHSSILNNKIDYIDELDNRGFIPENVKLKQ